MTKEEFKGFSSAAQHDMVLEALVRITKNLETMEKESGKPFVGTVKQRRNDIKLLTILAEAFGKNELVWNFSHDATKSDKVYITTGGGSRDVVKGLRQIVDDEQKIIKAQEKAGHFKSCESTDIESLYPVKNIEKSIDNSKVVVAGVGMERYNSKSMAELSSAIKDDWKKTYNTTGATINGASRGIAAGLRKVSDAGMSKRRSK
nr:MAG TPA: hypothetical protein [Caudoviricetes sp.]